MATELRQLGAKGEKFVGSYLEREGFTIRAYNYTQRFGEIDIIATRDELVVFVEVKLRRQHYFAISQVVSRSKQAKIIKTARKFLIDNHLTETVQRFDIAVIEAPVHGEYSIDYFPNAFTAPTSFEYDYGY